MEPDLISERNSPVAQRIADLAKSSRAASSLLIEDAEPLLQAIRSGVEFLDVYHLDSVEPPAEILAECAKRAIPVRAFASALATEVFRSEKRPKVFGVARVPRRAQPADLLSSSRDLVVLDGVKIVGNMGAIIRTSYALGAAGVILVDSDLPGVTDRRLIRASRGYVFSLPVILMDRQSVIDTLTGIPMSMLTFAAEGGHTTESLRQLNERVALVLGGEKDGVSNLIQSYAAETIGIQMVAGAESLNVSVCAGIALQARSSWNFKNGA